MIDIADLAIHAEKLQRNPALNEVFSRISQYLEAELLTADLNDKDKLQALISLKQSHQAIKDYIQEMVHEGELKEFELKKKQFF